MAKRKHTETTTTSLQDMNEPGPEELGVQTLAHALKDAAVIRHVDIPPEEAPIELVAEVSIPISEELPREFPIHLDVTLPPPSATTLRRIAIALDRQQARTSDGQRVVKPTQALRWLLEQATIRHVEPGHAAST